MKTINIKVDTIGNTTIDAEGFNGVGCKDATRPIEDALSDRKSELTSVEKPEIHNVDTEEIHETY